MIGCDIDSYGFCSLILRGIFYHMSFKFNWFCPVASDSVRFHLTVILKQYKLHSTPSP